MTIVQNGRLQNKVAIVTGGSTGIGEAICHKFALEGAKVVCVGLPDDPVNEVVDALTAKGSEAIGYLGDIASEDQARAAVEATIARFGRLDILINNAGVFLATAEVDRYPIEDFDRTVRMNLRSAFLMTKFALPHLQKTRGNIVSAGSEAGFNGLALNAPYGGTKAFIHAFMMGVAVEQAKYGVRANCVCPGAIDTAWTHKETGPMDAKMEKQLVDATPMARRGTPAEMANVYAFLASDESSYVTGALWLADGGVTPAKGAAGQETPRSLRVEPGSDVDADLDHERGGLENKEYHTIR
ncbi:MAG: SDR family oxidoreductase [Cytophagales bacterium]|nr:SDR family oxidoreductase [Armatimonadota bacterium]